MNSRIVVTRQDDNDDHERSALIIPPSASSTLRPSANNLDLPSGNNNNDGQLPHDADYGALLNGGGEQQQQQDDEMRQGLLHFSTTEIESSPSTPRLFRHGIRDYVTGRNLSKAERRRVRKQAMNLLLLLGVSVLLVLVVVKMSLFRNQAGGSSAGGGEHHPLIPPVPPRHRRPFSKLHPVHDLGLADYVRPQSSSPYHVLTHHHHHDDDGKDDKNKNNNRNNNRNNKRNKNNNKNNNNHQHFPTNTWYQNLLLVPDHHQPGPEHRAYSVPYVVDVVGPIPGLRVHPNHIDASTSVVQLSFVSAHALTVGAMPMTAAATSGSTTNNEKQNHRYVVQNTTPLGVTLQWESYPMSSSIVKGMPFATIRYDQFRPNPSAAAPAVVGSAENQTALNTTTRTTTTTSRYDYYPTVISPLDRLVQPPIVDQKTVLDCRRRRHDDDDDDSSSTAAVVVEREIELHFADSDFTWLVFVSEPVRVECHHHDDGEGVPSGTRLQFVERLTRQDNNDDDDNGEEEDAPFFIRLAVSNLCTSNRNPIHCRHEELLEGSLSIGQGLYGNVLRNHSRYYPGPNTRFDFEVHQDDDQNDETRRGQTITMHFDWDCQDMTKKTTTTTRAKATSTTTNNIVDNVEAAAATTTNDLLVYALPHHLDLMGLQHAPGYRPYCAHSLVGPACLLNGAKWKVVDRVPPVSFRAARPPAPWSLRLLADSLARDLDYTLPTFYQRGAGDTYFSGKMLVKLARTLLIAEEVLELCGQSSGMTTTTTTTITTTTRQSGDDDDIHHQQAEEYRKVCQDISLPSPGTMRRALAALRKSTQVWLDGTAKTPFVFDSAWGGVVSCGCLFDGTTCTNKFPDCAAFSDPGLNFGNAFYNDVHFHYGYHIYAAAVVAHFDHEWGKKFYQRVLLLVRNIANPSEDDYFPSWRLKDWYAGHSWASGIAQPVAPNGRNQESSSEAIAAYEAVALFGATMETVWEKAGSDENQAIALEVRHAGLALTATELRSARRYYHVRDHDKAMMPMKIYPREYRHWAIGMLWSTMGQYQTWFGAKPFLASGIQLLPITPIAEQRDGIEWAKKMYPDYADSCNEDLSCVSNGWSVLQLGLLATAGHPQLAAQGAVSLPKDVFESAGGNGHSLSNTLWYAATRPTVLEPLDLSHVKSLANRTSSTGEKGRKVDCERPVSCTEYVLDTIADEYSCRQRIISLIDTMGYTQLEACQTVAGVQFPAQCGPCNPKTGAQDSLVSESKPTCRPCTPKECVDDELNRCPKFPATFVCTAGGSRGGCSRNPWLLNAAQCTDCCELSKCPPPAPLDASICPPCDRDSCRGDGRKCPPQQLEPFLCTNGSSKGGCSFLPWDLKNGQCHQCCRILPGCDQ